MYKKKHQFLEKFFLKFPKVSNILYKYLLNNKLGKFLKVFQLENSIDYVYDIGAYKGEWSEFYRNTSLSKSKFILFEANKAHSIILKRKNFTFFNVVLSDKKKDVEFFNNNNSTGDSYYKENTFLQNNLDPIKLQTSTLDEVVQKNDLQKPDLIKIDTQGSEIDILKGSNNSTKNCKLIFLECPITNFNQNNLNIYDYIKYMKDIDYIPQEICGIHHFHGYLVQIDLLFVKKDYYKNSNFDLKLLEQLF